MRLSIHLVLLTSLLLPTGCAAFDPGLTQLSDPNVTPGALAVLTGQAQYTAGDYGLAENSFRAAVEAEPRNATAWLGLAASYDRLQRFDLADRAYEQVVRIHGPSVEVLNNRGYSYMLRGDYRTARKQFLAAYEREPNDPLIRNNIAYLDAVVARAR